ncbi:MAG: hypothetical protein Tsb0014_01310 [Pleurocapsa sp.]
MLEQQPNSNQNLWLNNQILITTFQYNRVLQILENYQKNNFAAYYKLPTLRQSIIHRCQVTNSSTIEDYLKLLENSIAEQDNLYNHLIPLVTEFFGDWETWESLANHVIPQLLLRIPVEREIRCWVVGCGTGEEAYSLAILLNEAVSATIPFRQVKILATDINTSALKIASKGVYPQKIQENISSKRLERYFEPCNDNFVVKRQLRQTIVFAPHNLIEDVGYARIDLICCRNFLTYLRPQYKTQVLSKFHNSLVSKGILLLDDYESLAVTNKNFVKLQYSGGIWQKFESVQSQQRRLLNRDPLVKRLNLVPSSLDWQRQIWEFSNGDYPGAFLILDRQYNLISVYYDTAELIRVPNKAQDLYFPDCISQALKPVFLQALEQAINNNTSVTERNLAIDFGNCIGYCDLKIGFADKFFPLPDAILVFFLEKTIVFHDSTATNFTVLDRESGLEYQVENLQDAVEKLRHKQMVIEKINQELTDVTRNLNALNQQYKLKVEILKQLNNDFENLLHSIDIGVVFLDRQLNIRKYNSASKKIINFRTSDIGRPLKDLSHNLESIDLIENLQEFLRNKYPNKLEVKKQQTEEHFLMKLHFYRSPSQYCEGIILTFDDISERKQAEQTLVYQAFYDSLTELPNRLLFKKQLQYAVARLSRQNSQFLAVMYLDLNGFKEVNDSLGHGAGDILLVKVANRLNKVIRSKDLVSRLGGDEFIILLDEIEHPQQSLEIASRIHQTLAKPFVIKSQQINISTSIGIAFYSAEDNLLDRNIETLMENADMAMYRAKQKGVAQTEIFLPSMRSKAQEVLEIKNQLYQALQREEFLLYYQPIFTLKERKLKGFEALLRWNHPKLGLISPNKFLPIVENSPLFFDLECWILKRACDRLQQWVQEFNLERNFSLSVNVSPQLFAHSSFLDCCDRLINKVESVAKHLTIELTETALIHNAKLVQQTIEKLRDKNIKIALDDFGTGFSSLAHLHQFSLDKIKIDRSFVMSLDGNKRSRDIVRSIIFLSQQLDLSLIAEGIEDSSQLEWLQNHNCQLGQGYFWSPPVSANRTTKFLNSFAKKIV